MVCHGPSQKMENMLFRQQQELENRAVGFGEIFFAEENPELKKSLQDFFVSPVPSLYVCIQQSANVALSQ
jgi:hypothetical protein